MSKHCKRLITAQHYWATSCDRTSTDPSRWALSPLIPDQQGQGWHLYQHKMSNKTVYTPILSNHKKATMIHSGLCTPASFSVTAFNMQITCFTFVSFSWPNLSNPLPPPPSQSLPTNKPPAPSKACQQNTILHDYPYIAVPSLVITTFRFHTIVKLVD